MWIRTFSKFLSPLFKLLDWLSPIGDLAARCWVAWIFFKSALVKVTSWQSTMFLFENEFKVPFLSPKLAALIGTGAELVLPVLLVLGLGSRLSIVIFFIYNLVAVISYPHLWTPEGAAGLDMHINWGLLLALLMFHGPGKLSLDHWLRKRYGHLLRPQPGEML